VSFRQAWALTFFKVGKDLRRQATRTKQASATTFHTEKEKDRREKEDSGENKENNLLTPGPNTNPRKSGRKLWSSKCSPFPSPWTEKWPTWASTLTHPRKVVEGSGVLCHTQQAWRFFDPLQEQQWGVWQSGERAWQNEEHAHIQVCCIPNLNVVGICRKRLKGDASCYRKVCRELLRLTAAGRPRAF